MGREDIKEIIWIRFFIYILLTVLSFNIVNCIIVEIICIELLIVFFLLTV